MNNIKVEDIKANSHHSRLPTYRHIYAYCMKKRFPSVKLWQIGKVINKTQVLYGIKTIENLLQPFNNENTKIPPEIVFIHKRIASFLELISEYNKSDLKIPERD